MATGVNGTVPGPLLRFREGERITLNVGNALATDSSIHWHGLLLPANMDGVPGISFAGIPASWHRTREGAAPGPSLQRSQEPGARRRLKTAWPHRRAANEDDNDVSLLAGVRFWF